MLQGQEKGTDGLNLISKLKILVDHGGKQLFTGSYQTWLPHHAMAFNV